jgi:hypothetical protein
MRRALRRSALIAHVVVSIGWLGAVGAFLVLAVAGAAATAQSGLGLYAAMDLITRFLLVPLSLGSLLTGVVMSLGTSWGLMRHYWVVFKLFITVVATVVLFLQLDAIRYLADVDANALATPAAAEMRTSLVVHAGGGLVVLILPTVLSIFKPKGLTRYGARRQQRGAVVS